MNTQKFSDPKFIGRLKAALVMSGKVAKFNDSSDTEAARLAHSYGELGRSFERFNSELIPALEGATDGEVVEEILYEIGEEFRRISYHLRAPRFYRYLFEE